MTALRLWSSTESYDEQRVALTFHLGVNGMNSCLWTASDRQHTRCYLT